jgi:hypothetical protein
MKVFEFINIISSYFSTQIERDPRTHRVRDSVRYQTVLTWFTTVESDEIKQVNDAIMKSDNFCSKLLNGNSGKDMPIQDANYLKSKITSENFQEIFDNAGLTNESIKALKKEFKDKGNPLVGRDLVKEITKVLIDILNERSNVNRKIPLSKAIFIGNNKLQIGKKIINLPEPLEVPNLPETKENKYINALFEVYTQKTNKVIVSLADLEFEPFYKANLQLHREFYYSAESVLHQIRDFISDSYTQFANMKQEVYDAIKYHLSLPDKDAFNKLNSTMNLVIMVSFSKAQLAKPGNGIIGPSEKSGMVHMLVNDGKVTWL